MCRLFESAPALLAQQQNLSLQRPPRTRGDARPARGDGISATAGGDDRGAALACAHLPRLAWRAGAEKSCRACPGHHRSVRTRGKSRCGSCGVRSFSRRLARRRTAPLAVAAKSRSDALHRTHPRRRPAACRYSVATPARYRSADRAEAFWRVSRGKRLEADLAQALGETRSHEDVLDAIRLFGQEHMFLIGARILSGSVAAEQAGGIVRRTRRCPHSRVARRVEAISPPRTAASAARRPRSWRSAGLARVK